VAGVSYAARKPHRGRKPSGAGLAKLVLIKLRCQKAAALVKRARVDASTAKPINLFDLDNAEAILETIIDLCEEESIPNDER
jgi:hypothetical protein